MSDTEQSEMQAMLTRWQTLKKQAEGGELLLDSQIRERLVTHAEQMRTKLDAMVNKAAELEHLSGFGSLTSAGDLRQKFALKANNGTDSAVKRLQQSIDIVTLMKETYELAIGKITESDQSVADKLAALNTGGA
ncbi:hypothetical protein [Nocardia sp. XZ_19_369]|uniref:hypothetical protein n=1 Tax=Nocardia sp. XZ_19_369 TaxID=2769487 RepID=UPI00189010DD|nr:hypothetical protein [Nocardia sp. XZ_19_369]